MASFSRSEASWQPTFKLNNKPLPTFASVRAWAYGDGGRVAQSLVQSLLLLEDVHVFSDRTDESLARQLQCHTIVVISYPFFSHLF